MYFCTQYCAHQYFSWGSQTCAAWWTAARSCAEKAAVWRETSCGWGPGSPWRSPAGPEPPRGRVCGESPEGPAWTQRGVGRTRGSRPQEGLRSSPRCWRRSQQPLHLSLQMAEERGHNKVKQRRGTKNNVRGFHLKKPQDYFLKKGLFPHNLNEIFQMYNYWLKELIQKTKIKHMNYRNTDYQQ